MIDRDWLRAPALRITSILLFGTLASACSSAGLNEGQVRVGTHTLIADGASDVSAKMFARPGTTGKSTIGENEDFQITLLSAYICDFRELGDISSAIVSRSNYNSEKCDGAGLLQGEETRGEIAIHAGFHFRDQTANQPDIPEERLIYFNEDVRESGQLLNFVNLPVYGPAPYQNAASKLRLSILEIDQQEVEEQVAVLKTLASVGATFSSPATGPVLEVLSKVGETLLQSNEDDIELAFDMGFDPASGESQVYRNELREGYLVVMRREVRSDKNHFDDIYICPEHGVIVQGNSCADNNYYDRSTWLLLRISKEDKSVADATVTATLEQVLKARAPDTNFAVEINGALANLKEAMAKE